MTFQTLRSVILTHPYEYGCGQKSDSGGPLNRGLYWTPRRIQSRKVNLHLHLPNDNASHPTTRRVLSSQSYSWTQMTKNRTNSTPLPGFTNIDGTVFRLYGHAKNYSSDTSCRAHVGKTVPSRSPVPTKSHLGVEELG